MTDRYTPVFPAQYSPKRDLRKKAMLINFFSMKKILLIEDNLPIRENMVEILELAGYTVFSADNGKAGLAMAIMEMPDLILCDIMMPEMDGYEVLNSLNMDPQFQSIPFIFMTAMSERTEISKGMEMGANDYLVKPFDNIDLLRAVDKQLQRADWLQQPVAPGIEGLQQLLGDDRQIRHPEQHSKEKGTYHFTRSQTIYEEGTSPSGLYLVEQGHVKTYSRDKKGNEELIDTFQEGDLFGYDALLKGINYRETAEAQDDVHLSIIAKRDFDELMITSQAAIRKFIGLLVKGKTDTENKLLQIVQASFRRKVANALVKLYRQYGPPDTISMSQLAIVIGTGSDSLTKALMDLRMEGLIGLRENAILILNEKELEILGMGQ